MSDKPKPNVQIIKDTTDSVRNGQEKKIPPNINKTSVLPPPATKPKK